MKTYYCAGVLTAGFLFSVVSLGQDASSVENWPRVVDANGFHLVIYQPQVDSWKNNRLEARAAVTATRPGATQESFGIVTLNARTDVDKMVRTVWFEDVKISSVSFPGAKQEQGELERAVRDSLPGWPRDCSLDRLLADLAINGAEAAAPAMPLKNDPPKIILSQVPSVLILIDGEPVMKPVEGAARYTHVINTPAVILFDTSASRYYLDGGTLWMTAANLNGPWTQASDPPADLNAIKDQVLQGEEKDPHDHTKDAVPPPSAPPSSVYVSTTPAELIQTTGQPQYAVIPNTQLAYVTNTSSDVFRDAKTQSYYVLLTGRWYQSKSLDGPWNWLSGSKLPKDFTRIPNDHPKASVLVSIPGTEQAKEAVIANQIPQTATVKRSEAKLSVTYDGPPQFRAIAGTSLEYAVNTSGEVVHAAGRYYAVRNGVWFVADAPEGPWVVADNIPAEIYSIPPSNPLYHDRYVYVYGSTPDVVYVGYTPGYLGAFAWDDTVVFGTGWWYPGWIGGYWYGWPWTWGFGFQFGYFGGGWLGWPGGYWWYHNPGYLSRVYYDHWNTHWAPGDRERIGNNVNVYNRWGSSAVAARSVRAGAAGRAGVAGGQRDVYAGRDGRVYERQNNTWMDRSNPGQARRVQPTPELRQQQQSRSFGQSRTNEFGNSGFSRGFPRSMPSFGGGGGGGFGGRRR
jgi:hypothetical protein